MCIDNAKGLNPVKEWDLKNRNAAVREHDPWGLSSEDGG